ncbi:MAG: hypothetical protein V1799_01700 [bacterium]
MVEKVFKYKLDFYYMQSLSYLLVFFLYAGVKGSFFEDHFMFVFKDPIVYIMSFFVVISLATLLLNLFRNRNLVITEDRITFRSRKKERQIKIADIEWMYIGREALVQTAGRFQMIILKRKSRRRLIRIRVGRYEHSHELIAEMERIAQHVPKGTMKSFGMRRRKP